MTMDDQTRVPDSADAAGYVPDPNGAVSMFVFGLAVALLLVLIVAIAMAM